ncbi:uncharacterized protein LOC112539070 [Tetranychus urticae]|uniref:Uncharacterized protein n=1 Tax=Tetranychus urticae TaxID=32264 RepID=T1KGT4_TETUR|nr:uncharacterized protein LOC112539070 [Tetranychus urticae]
MRSDQPLLPSNPPTGIFLTSSELDQQQSTRPLVPVSRQDSNPWPSSNNSSTSKRGGGSGSGSATGNRQNNPPNLPPPHQLYRSRHRETDTETLLTYTKGFLVCAYFVFIIGSGITIKELFTFLFDDYRYNTEWITGIIILILIGISVLGIYGAFKEDSCILLVYGCIILTVFLLHIALLLVLKNACADKRDVCSKNVATPPGLAPILVAISELAIALSAFFMTLVIESEKKKHSVPRLYPVGENSCQTV